MKTKLNILDLIEIALSSEDTQDSEKLRTLHELLIFYLDSAMKELLFDVLNVDKLTPEFTDLAIELLRRINNYSKFFTDPLSIDFDEIERHGLDKELFKSNKSDKYELLKEVKGKEIADDTMKKSMFLHLSKKYERYITASFKAFMGNDIDVAYTLLRMPYFDIHFFMERIVSEPDELLEDVLNRNPREYDYIFRYKHNENKKAKIKQVISESFRCVHKKDIDSKLLDDIYSLRFDNESEFSMLNIIQKSNHLVTTSATGASGVSELNFTFLGDMETVRPLAEYYLVLSGSILRTSVTYIYYVFKKTIALKEGNKGKKIVRLLLGLLEDLRGKFIEDGATEEDIRLMIQELKR